MGDDLMGFGRKGFVLAPGDFARFLVDTGDIP